jgi:hypothetical protein
MVLKKIGVLSLAKVAAVIYAFLGLVIVLIVAIAILVGTLAGSLFSFSLNHILGILLAFGAIILFPIFYGALGFLIGVVTSAIYNWITRITGGIILELE